jgi:hypothetical protein
MDKYTSISNTYTSASNTFLKYYMYIFNGLIIATYIGIGITVPKWMTVFDYYLKIMIGLFIVYRFNPFRTIVFDEFDRRVAFSAGMILLTSTVINKLLTKFSTTYRSEIIKTISNIKN